VTLPAVRPESVIEVDPTILVAVNVSVAKVRSESSVSNPEAPAKVTLPEVNPESVTFAKVGEDVVVRFCPVSKANSVFPIELAMTLKVAVSVAEVVALIVEESDNVRVSPELIVCGVVPSVKVNRSLVEVTQVEQVRVSVPPKATLPPPPRGEVVLTVTEEFTNSELPTEFAGKTTSPSPVLSVVRVIEVVDDPPRVNAAAPPGKTVSAAVASLSLEVKVTVPASFLPKVKVEFVALSKVSEFAKVIAPFTVSAAKVGEEAVVRFCPVLKAS